MGWVLIIFGGLMVLFTLSAFFVKPRDEKDAENSREVRKSAKYLIPIGAVLMLIGAGINSQKSSSQTEATQQTSQTANQQQSPEPPQLPQKTFGSLSRITSDIEDLFAKTDVKYTKEKTSFTGSSHKVLYKTDVGSIEVIGEPDVVEGSVMFYPTNDIGQALVVVMTPFKVFCNPKTKEHTKSYSEFIGEGIRKQGGIQTEIENCHIEFLEYRKDMPLMLVNFKPIK